MALKCPGVSIEYCGDYRRFQYRVWRVKRHQPVGVALTSIFVPQVIDTLTIRFVFGHLDTPFCEALRIKVTGAPPQGLAELKTRTGASALTDGLGGSG